MTELQPRDPPQTDGRLLKERLQHALRRHDELRSEITGWLGQDLRHDVAYVPAERAALLMLVVSRPAQTIRWGLLAGEVVYQLRALLDNIAYAFVEHETGEMSTKSRWPLATSGADFDGQHRGDNPPLRSLDAGSVWYQFVRERQPYVAGFEFTRRLNGLRNRDAHRVLSLAPTISDSTKALEAAGLFVRPPHEVEEIRGFAFSFGADGTDRVPIARLTFATPFSTNDPPSFGYAYDLQLPLNVVFVGDDGPVFLGELRRWCDAMRDLVTNAVELIS